MQIGREECGIIDRDLYDGTIDEGTIDRGADSTGSLSTRILSTLRVLGSIPGVSIYMCLVVQ